MFSYTWILHEFSKISSTYSRDESLSSPIFNFNGCKWQLNVCVKTNDQYTSAYLRAVGESQGSVKCAFYAKNINDEILAEFKEKTSSCTGITTIGSVLFLKPDDHLKELEEDILKISVVIGTGAYSSGFVLYSSEEAVLENLKVLLHDKILTDFIIKIGNFELPIHKAVLAASSSVFLKMFQSDTLENNEGYMIITDIDKETLILLTDFLYKGKIEKLSYDEAKKLLYAADKYNMVDLMQICETVLISELKVSNFFDILLFADVHHRLMLKNTALNYMVENHWMFSNDLKVQEISEKLPQTLLKEILLKLLSNLPRETKVEKPICEVLSSEIRKLNEKMPSSRRFSRINV